MKTTLQVKGMHCSACEMLIKEALLEQGASEVNVDLKSETVTIIHEPSFDKNKLSSIIQQEGYEVVR